VTDPVFRRTLDGLFWLAGRCDDLAESRHIGTARPWRESHGQETAEQAEQRAAQAAAEHADRNPLAIGEHPAPVHVDTLDLLVDLLCTADDIAERVAQAAGVDRMPYPASSFASAEPYLRHAAAWLKVAVEALPPLLDYVSEQVERIKPMVEAALRERLDGQRVPGLCPWCAGGTARRQTLSVRLVKPTPELDPIPAAVCESGVCEPPEPDVGLWHGRRPAWPIDTEGDWLKKRIRHAAESGPKCRAPRPTEQDPDARCDEPLLPTGKAGRPAVYCSAECRRRALAERRREEREAC
jgi:hypothetical protein